LAKYKEHKEEFQSGRLKKAPKTSAPNLGARKTEEAAQKFPALRSRIESPISHCGGCIMKTQYSIAVLFLAIILMPVAAAQATLTYNYQGENFTAFFDGGGGLNSSDFVSGFVTFGSEPTADEVGKSDVTAFSFAAGSLTMSPPAGTSFSFDFDAGVNIVDWQVVIQTPAPPQFDGTVGNIIVIDSAGDLAGGGTYLSDDVIPFSYASNADPGTWSLVPEPSTLTLSALGLLGLLACGRRRRR